MRDFNDIFEEEKRRASQRDIEPQAVKNSAVANNVIASTTVSTLGPFSVANGSSLDVTSTIANSANANNRLGAVPYQICFFESSLSLSKIIPGGSGVTGTYDVIGPLAMPQFSPGGSDGNNLLFRTRLTNNSGATKTIYCLTNTRFIGGIGGSAA